MITRKLSFFTAVLFVLSLLLMPMTFVAAAEEEAARAVVREPLLGDVNGDDALSTTDVRDLLRYILGVEAFTIQQAKNADYTQDLRVTSTDARLLLRVLAGNPPTTTVTTQVSTTTTTEFTTTTTVFYGIDVSYAQGEINWTEVQESGVSFAILRMGYGQDDPEQDDEYWEANVAACEEIGMPYGAYFFCYARNASEAIGEAKHALRLLEGKDPTLPVFLDMEYSDYQGNLTKEEYAAIAKYFCTTLSNAGYKVGVYANLDWWNTRLTDPCFDQWYRWVAQYNDECEYEGTYHLWQYDDGVTIPGVTENTVDVNYCYVNFAALKEERSELE